MSRVFPLLALLWASFGADAATTDRLRVVVSVIPLQTIVAQVGGDWVEVTALVQAGHSPATYDPTPGQIAVATDADLLVRVGVPFERVWMPRLRALGPDMTVLDVRQATDLIPLQAHAHDDHGSAHASSADRDEDEDEHGHGHGDFDPHLWTDPLRVRQMAFAVRDALVRLRPQAKADLARNTQRFEQRLLALHDELQALLTPLAQRSFLVFHPAWGYFAQRYGLEQIAIEHLGKTPNARQLSRLVARARRDGIGTVFVQPQFHGQAAQRVASSINGRLVQLDPLAADVFASLRTAAQAIALAAAQP